MHDVFVILLGQIIGFIFGVLVGFAAKQIPKP